jgi:hypothetical protein
VTGELAMESSDERFRQWMKDNLHRAAAQFGLTVHAAPVFGWRLRSIGAQASGPHGPRWLRVVSDYPQWASGDGWTGNTDANTLTGLAKPRVLDVAEWDDDRRCRAEVMTLLPTEAVSATDVLHHAVMLPTKWWSTLQNNLDLLRQVDTTRVNADQATVTRRVMAAFGTDLPVQRWETVHGDLHWSNLLGPTLGILDWELWGRGPAGTDAASLLCHSLLVPAIADRVRDVFAQVLDTPTGRTAQLAVVARMLGRVSGGDYPELEAPLRQHAVSLDQHVKTRQSNYWP